MLNHILRLLVMTALGASAGCSKAATGSENGACYGNGTCNTGLVCLSNVCVNPGSSQDLSVAVDLSSSTDAATAADLSSVADLATRDAARYDDGGLACPGAEILHPSSDPRKVNTSVPFVGRARDTMCMAITGASLVWTDNLEGQIGTGETFSHTFTMLGSHTVTLAASDGANTYYASVTFMITN
jgi:PKD domain